MLVSSHLLAEVQHTVDDVVIIRAGRLVRTAPLAELGDLEDAFLSLTDATPEVRP